jgi:hypothetical protein
MCVIVEIRETTRSIIIVILSIKKPSLISKSPKSIHVKEASCLNPGSCDSSILPNIANDKIKVSMIVPIPTKSPCRGKRLPTNIKIMNDIRGKNNIPRA